MVFLISHIEHYNIIYMHIYLCRDSLTFSMFLFMIDVVFLIIFPIWEIITLYICVCTYIYMRIIHICLHMYIYICMHIFIYIYVCVYIYIRKPIGCYRKHKINKIK